MTISLASAQLWRTRPGAMLFITVLIVGTIGLIVAASVASRGHGEISMGESTVADQQATAHAHTCAQDVLYRLSLNSSYTGETLTIGTNGDTCISTIATVGTIRIARISGKTRRWTQKLFMKIETNTTPDTILEYYLVP